MCRLALFLLLTLGAAMPAPAQEPLTETSLRAMPPDAMARRLLGETAAIAFPYRNRFEPGSDGIVAVSFLTRPTASSAAGICETRLLSVVLVPLGAPDPDTPLRVREMSTSTWFILQDVRAAGTTTWPNVGPNSGRQDGALARFDAACAAIDPRQAALVLPEDAHAAAVGRAVALVTDLAGSAHAGRLAVPTACDDWDQHGLSQHRVSRQDCLQMLAPLRADSLDYVRMLGEGCAGVSRRSEHRCLEVWVWDPQHESRVEIDFVLSYDWVTLIRINVRPQFGNSSYD